MTALWSCDENKKLGCRNTHGCHCREIADLQVQVARLERDIKIITERIEGVVADAAGERGNEHRNPPPPADHGSVVRKNL